MADHLPGNRTVDRRRSAIVNVGFHYVAMVLVLVQGILLTPLYLRHVSVSLFGAWLATGSILSWIEMVDPGISSVLQQKVAAAYGGGDLRRLPGLIGTGIAIGAAISAAPLLAWPAAPLIGRWVCHDTLDAETLTTAFRWALGGTSLSLASYAVTAVNIGLQRPWATGLIFTAASVIGMGATILLLHGGMGLVAIPLGLFLRAALMLAGNGAALLLWGQRHLPAHWTLSREEVVELGHSSVYTFVSRLGSTLVARMDALVTAAMISPEAAAMLSLTGRAYDPVRMATERLTTAISPALAHLAGEGKRDRVGDVSFLVLRVGGVLAAAGMACVVALDRQFVHLWVGDSLFAGQTVTIALGIAAGLAVLSTSMNQVAFALGGIRQTALATLGEGVLRVGLQLALARTLGIVGLPIAAIISTMAVPVWYLPRVIAGLAGVPSWRAAATVFWSAGSLGALVVAGAILQPLTWRLVVGSGWPRFALAAGLLGIGASLVAALALPESRRWIFRRRAWSGE